MSRKINQSDEALDDVMQVADYISEQVTTKNMRFVSRIHRSQPSNGKGDATPAAGATGE